MSENACEELLRQLRDMSNGGFIHPSTSPWAAPVLIAAQMNGELRLCINYRALNKQTVKKCYL